jgi:hypothetical protein
LSQFKTTIRRFASTNSKMTMINTDDDVDDNNNDDEEQVYRGGDDSWLNSSLDSLMLLTTLVNDRNNTSFSRNGGTASAADSSFASYDVRADLRLPRVSHTSHNSNNNNNNSSFRSGSGGGGGGRGGVDDDNSSDTTLDVFNGSCNNNNNNNNNSLQYNNNNSSANNVLWNDSASSYDLAQLFKDNELLLTTTALLEEPIMKQVRFSTVTVREFSLALGHDDDDDDDDDDETSLCFGKRNGIECCRSTLDKRVHTPDVVRWLPPADLLQGDVIDNNNNSSNSTGNHQHQHQPQRVAVSQRPVHRGWTKSRRNLKADIDRATEQQQQSLTRNLRTIQEATEEFHTDHAKVA